MRCHASKVYGLAFVFVLLAGCGSDYSLLPQFVGSSAEIQHLTSTSWNIPPAKYPCVTGNILFIVGGLPLSSDDNEFVQRLMAMGMGVVSKKDADVTDTDTTGKDLIVISATVVPARLLVNYQNVAVPVLLWEHELYDDLGMSGSETDHGVVTGGTKVAIIPGHAIAAGLFKTVDVYSQAADITYGKSGGLGTSSAVTTPGTGNPTVFSFEQGKSMVGGIIAPARRVGIFLGPASATKLTPEGWRLIDDAVMWAMAKLPAYDVMLVSPKDLNTLAGGDLALKQRLEQLRFRVIVVKDQEVAQTSTTGKKLIVVTQSVSPAKVGAKFNTVTIPVVVAAEGLFDDLGLTSSAANSGTTVGETQIEIVDPNHTMAAGLSGKVLVASAPMTMSWGKVSAPAAIVGRLTNATSNAGLFGYEKGNVMPGRTAPERRVGIFVGDAALLSPSGWRLFDSAVQWASQVVVQCNVICFVDSDGDGIGSTTTVTSSDNDCTDPGESNRSDDCDDQNALRFPGAVDLPDNGVDEDCNGFDTVHCFQDLDNDTYGSATQILSNDGDCSDPGESVNKLDCTDTDKNSFPNATELCDGNDNNCDGTVPTNESDSDGDRVVRCTNWSDTQRDQPLILGGGDCDDDIFRCGAKCFPGNTSADVCDGYDQDCDGLIDEQPNLLWYHDADRDGYTNSNDKQAACTDPDGADVLWVNVPTLQDCDDTNATRFPGNQEILNNGIDEDCNGVDAVQCYEDRDADGFGSQVGIVGLDGDCLDPGESNKNTDCNDTDGGSYPGAAEVCDGNDNNCDGVVLATETDDDGDGYVECSGWSDTQHDQVGVVGGGDCDDDSTRCGVRCFPGNIRADICDGYDQDCDGFTDEQPNVTWYHDADRDGFTNSGDKRVVCADPDGAGNEWVAVATVQDCDDDATRCGVRCFPGNSSADVCDGYDQDCDGSIDEQPNVTWYHDADHDGFTNNSDQRLVCVDPDGAGIEWVNTTTAQDCNDNDSSSRPGAVEVCDGNDNNCDGTVPGTETDNDGDGYVECSGWIDTQHDNLQVLGGLDCDDDSTRCGVGCFPGNASADVCDGYDQDCDGSIDEQPNVMWYHDADRDGFTNSSDKRLACMDPDGAATEWVKTATAQDCDDNPTQCGAGCFPGNPSADVCDNRDQDCDGSIDEQPNVMWYHDADRDGFTNSQDQQAACVDPDGVGIEWVSTATAQDCDDNPTRCGAKCFPGNTSADVCDGYDQDCDGLIDEQPNLLWYHDADRDGYTNSNDKQAACTDPDGADVLWVNVPTLQDCDDTNATRFPGNQEILNNGIDEDCNGVDAVQCYEDRDADGFGSQVGIVGLDGDCLDPGESNKNTDCNDTDGGSYPGAAEVCDGNDNNCDGVVLATETDDDGDGYVECSGWSDTQHDQVGVVGGGDCDDDSTRCGVRCFPGNIRADICDGYDQDCDGFTDEQPNVTWYHDADRDGFTNSGDKRVVCVDPDGAGNEWVAVATVQDCDDDATRCGVRCFPGNSSADVCDGYDQDCDGSIDEQPNVTWYHDADHDGFTNNSDQRLVCVDPDGAGIEWVNTTTAQDCNDNDSSSRPGAVEVCDGNDNNCDGTVPGTETDNDGDGYVECSGWIDTQHDNLQVLGGLDCDDDSTRCGVGCFPGNASADVCDGYDQDCDGSIDEQPNVMWYHDADRDGFTNSSDKRLACMDPDGAATEWVKTATAQDCDDNPTQCGAGCFPGNPSADVCDNRDQDCDGSIDEQPNVMWYHDADRDGFTNSQDKQATCVDPDGVGIEWVSTATAQDCDDNPTRCGAKCFPGNTSADVCDGYDQDCDGLIDEQPNLLWYHDADRDGYTNSNDKQAACTDPDGADVLWVNVPTLQDCDDTNATRFPGNQEILNNGIDEDCNGVDAVQCYEDRDADGFGSQVGIVGLDGDCLDPGESNKNTDCNDMDGGSYPGAAEVCDGNDNNCDGVVLATETDDDGDGYVECSGWSDTQHDQVGVVGGGDCDDDSTRCGVRCFPGNIRADICDGYDQDCDGFTDEQPNVMWYHDADRDGFTNSQDRQVVCGDPDGPLSEWVSTATAQDCDDNPAQCGAGCYPGNTALDVCDNRDQDCDGLIDEQPNLTWYHDADGDGFTNNSDKRVACVDPDGVGREWVSTATAQDCDDNPNTCGAGCYPGNTAPDGCDGYDQDCDGAIDEQPNLTWYHDADHDGYTNNNDKQVVCVDPDGAATAWVGSATAQDCDDTTAARHPGATEIPGNGIDEDCNGADGILCYEDKDHDGYGGPVEVASQDADCSSVQGSSNNLDCNDLDGTSYPGAAEACDGNDNNCDAVVPPAEVDNDGDRYVDCLGWNDTQHDQTQILGGGDCDDNVGGCGAGCYPGNPAQDICDGRDQDCDGLIDEQPNLTWYHDADRDGFTNNSDKRVACVDPDGVGIEWVSSATAQDCDDNPNMCGAGCYPGNSSADACDNRDQDCDGLIDEQPNTTWYHDMDRDGYTNSNDKQLSCTDPDGNGTEWVLIATPEDCNDQDNSSRPGAAEICDGNDNNCDGQVPLIELDRDGDGYVVCLGWNDLQNDQPLVQGGSDCDDNITVCGLRCYPGNTALDGCDGYDQDCDGAIDEQPNLTWYHDADRDGFTDNTDTRLLCTDPDGSGIEWVAIPTLADCDDQDNTSKPGALELCDGNDNNCDDIVPGQELDLDEDGYVACSNWNDVQNDQADILGGGDCNDNISQCGVRCFPGNQSADVCDGYDQDCDGAVDEQPNLTWYHDADGDGFTNINDKRVVCGDPDGSATQWLASPTAQDCDDDQTRCGTLCFPGNPAQDICDSYDQDCDGFLDEQPNLTWYHDSDRDSFTNSNDKIVTCIDPDGDGMEWISPATAQDCNDLDSASRPNATEVCDGNDNNCDAVVPPAEVDNDGDRYVDCLGWNDTQHDQTQILGGGDCDDNVGGCGAGCYPGNPAQDICDGRDQDCDGLIDEQPNLTWYHDADRDGFTNNSDKRVACVDPDGVGIEWVSSATTQDCDDLPSTCGAGCYPGNSSEDGCDSYDQDCDGAVDEEPNTTWYHDMDRDGYTNSNDKQLSCTDPDGNGTEWVLIATPEDCNDQDNSSRPGAAEICDGNDNNCDGQVPLIELDRDGDGYVVCLGWNDLQNDQPLVQGGGDCDDNITVCGLRCYPGNTALDGCDGYDQDCDGAIDEQPNLTWYHDADRDGFTDNTDTRLLCTDPDGSGIEWVAIPTLADCDDQDNTSKPGALELCDGNDNNCDDIVPGQELDLDEDGYVACSNWNDVQNDQADILGGGDCNDNISQCGVRCFPGNQSADVCDGYDQDCDGAVDEQPNLTWYHDADGDGFTNINDKRVVCGDPDGSATQWLASPTAQDCDDDQTRCGTLCFPGNTAQDICDSYDQDCDGFLDEQPNLTWYHDSDRDSFTNSNDKIVTCIDPDGDGMEWISPATAQDCNDLDSASRPNATEVCDGNDNNCDAVVPPAEVDNDGDRYVDCLGWNDTQHDQTQILGGGDCDDNVGGCGAGCYPGNPAQDICDGRDQDCDSFLDEQPNISWYHDADLDGYTNNNDRQITCIDPDGPGTAWVNITTTQDCDDDSTRCGAGCYPGNTAPDVCDNRDQDCDGLTDEQPNFTWYHDADHDGFTNINDEQTVCLDPDGTGTDWVSVATTQDCDDDSTRCGAGCYPGNAAPDVCDNRDQDCDGLIDEQPNLFWYHDADRDGFTNNNDKQTACVDPDGSATEWLGTATVLDCNDQDATSRPNAVEVCDGNDNNCDGVVVVTEIDNDGDRYVECTGWSDTQGDNALIVGGNDCNDVSASISPGAIDIPDNGIDENCSGTDSVTCYVDNDLDSYGFFLTVIAADGDCTDPGESTVNTDCNDSSAAVHPGAQEVPDDGIDQNCDGMDSTECYVDNDGDTFGVVTTVFSLDNDCDDAHESDFDSDCNDTNASIYPGAPDSLGDGIDQDCDGFDG